MKKETKINTSKLAVTFAGCFLGAGYISGQEMWQFFGSFGGWGIAGLVLAMAVFSAVGIMLVRLAQRTGLEDMDRLLVFFNAPGLRALLDVMEVVFLFGTAIIMAAGVGATFNQLFGIPAWIVCAVFITFVAILTLAGIRGMLSVFSVCVPILAAFVVGFFVFSSAAKGFPDIPAPQPVENPLLSNWAVSALAFSSYNIFECVAIMAPVAKMVEGEKTARRGIPAGAVILFVIGLCVILSLFNDPAAADTEMPMLRVATDIHPALGYVFSIALFFAMLQSTLASFLTSTSCFSRKVLKKDELPRYVIIIAAAVMFAGSLFGFGRLITLLYPVYGYLTAIYIVLLVAHYVKVSRKSARDD